MENNRNVPNGQQQGANQKVVPIPNGVPPQQGRPMGGQPYPNQQGQPYPNQGQPYPNQGQPMGGQQYQNPQQGYRGQVPPQGMNPNQQGYMGQQPPKLDKKGRPIKPKTQSTKKGAIIGTLCGMIVTGGIFAGLVYGKVFTIDEQGLYHKTVELQAVIEQMAKDYDQLSQDKDNMTITEVSKSTSLQYIEGTKAMQLVSVDNRLIFPTKLELTYTKLDAALSKVQVGSFFEMIPTSSWTIKNSGNTVLLNHTSGIQGTVQSLAVDADKYDETVNFLGKHTLEDHRNNILKFFTDFPKAEIEFRKMYFGTIEVGYLAKATLDIDGKPSELIVFSMTQGYNGLQGVFKYEQAVGTGYESVEVLLETIKRGEDLLVVE